MSFITIPPSWIIPGQPTKKELFERIKDNEDDLNSRLTTVETVTNITNKIDFEINGNYKYYLWAQTTSGGTFEIDEGIMYERVPIAIILLAARHIQYNAGYSGTTTFDIKMSTGGPFSSIFTTTPSVTAANGDLYVSSNGILSTVAVPANAILRMDILTSQTHVPYDAKTVLSLEYEVA